MFVFYEGLKELPTINLDGVYTSIVGFDEPLSFNQAIITLAERAKYPDQIHFLWNFFSNGCRYLQPYERRGLERIALGNNAIEFYIERQQTRFLVSIEANSLRLTSIATTIQSLNRDEKGSGIGNFRVGNILLVGDCPGAKALGYNTPFVGSGSGRWLLKKLEDANIPEDKYYWINAKDGFGVETEQTFLDNLKPKKIITLGNEAAKWTKCLANRYNVQSCRHPQYWLRFRSAEEYPLLKLLK